MIYQLKVNLKHMPSPVWRQIEIDSSITFAHLHYMLQIAFEWEDAHLHSYFIHRSNGKNVLKERIEISPIMEGILDFALDATQLDEDEEVVEKWLVKENDSCIYTYDFGDDWQHEIILEKIVERVDGQFYPRCNQAEGISPEEDSFGMLEEIEKADSEEICNEINEHYREFFTMEPVEASQKQWKELFSLADELKKLQPWTWMMDGQIFALKNPLNDETVYCSILGAANQEFGLAVYIGEKGLSNLNKLVTKQPIIELIYEQQSVLVSFSNRDELEKEDYALIKSLDLKYRGKKQWPLFRSFVPGYYPWFLNRAEVEMLIAIIPHVVHVCKQIKGQPSLVPPYDGKSMPSFDENGESRMIATDMIKSEKQTAGELPEDELYLKRMKKQYRRVDVPIEVDFFYLNEPVQKYEGQRPFFPIMILAVERENELIVYQDLISPDEMDAIPDCMMTLFQNLEALPTEIWIQRDELRSQLEPLASILDIKLKHLPKLKLMSEIKKELFALRH